MRKEAGFEVMNHINVFQDGNDKLAEILKKHTTDSIEKEIDMISKDEEKSATMCKSERYNFIYDLLILLGLIKEEEKGRKEKSRFIGDCLKAYYKITTEQKKYLR